MRQKSRGVTTASTAEGGNNLIGEERLIGEALIPTQELVFADFSLDTLLKKVAVEHPKQPIWKLPFSVPALKDWCVLEATPLAIVVFQESSSTQIAWPRGVQHYHIESEWFFEVFWCVFWPVWLPWPTDESLLPVFYHDETACWFTHSPLESLIMTYVRRLRRLILLWYQICKNKIPKFICLS